MQNVDNLHTAHRYRRIWQAGTYCLSVLALLLGLSACTADADPEQEQSVQGQALEAVSCMTTFHEETPPAAASEAPVRQAATRAGFPPAGYSYYADLYGISGLFKNQFSNAEATICTFFTKGESTFIEGTNATTPNEFSYHSFDDKWVVTPAVSLNGTYHVYGYVPKQAAASVSLSGSDFTSGAVLTLNDVQTVTPYDLCVIVAAKDAEDIVRGDFTFHTSQNKLYLLFDHLFSALKFDFKVDAEYNALRTIKITKLELMAFESDNETRLKSRYSAVIRLNQNGTGDSPVESVVYTPDVSSGPMSYQTLYDGAEVELKTDVETSFMGCFVPGGSTYFMLRTTYNVYDKAGNLIRERCEAENAINVRAIFKMASIELARGHMYSLTITVNPTYLYVLSDPDLDNPTIKIE